MIPELGQLTLILALALAIVQTVLPIAGAQLRNYSWMALARPTAQLQFIFLAIAFALLTWSFIQHDFSVAYVANNSNSMLPLMYRISAVWGAHEGSLLLWALILSGWTLAVSIFSQRLPLYFVARVIGVMGSVSIGFLLFMLLTSNPFDRLLPVPMDGADLNPLLQDPGLIIHPPMLYMGYVGFSVAFGFAIAALLGGNLDSAWARWSRPWTIMAWVFLTVGIALGSWWAYYELGWGGWWAWDPVENASFMPWLAGTALIHSVRVVERRDALKGWSVLLAITTFSLSLVGTFLVRSGVLTSVHAFAVDPARGVFILAILVAAIGGSLTVYALRASSLRATGRFDPVSREGALVVNNALLIAACATVFVGTFYPLFIDVLTGDKISVGAPYFNLIFTKIAAVTLALAAVGTLLAWKRASMRAVLKSMVPAGAAAIVAGIVVLVIADRERAGGAFALMLVVWLAGGAMSEIAQRTKLFRAPIKDSLSRARGLPGAAWGAALAHMGLALFALGAAGLSLWKSEEVVLMAEGDQAAVAGYNVTLTSVERLRGPNYEAERAVFSATKGGETFTLSGERRFYPIRGMETSEAAIRAHGPGDLYISFGENASGRGWPVRLFYNPFVGCLWWGAGLTAFGGLVAFADRGRRPARLNRKIAVKPGDMEAAPA